MHHLLCSQWLPVLPSLVPFVYHSASQLMCFSRQQLSLSVSLSQAGTHYCHINAGHLLCAPPSDETLPPPTAAPPRARKPHSSLQICANLPIPPYCSLVPHVFKHLHLLFTHNIFVPELIPQQHRSLPRPMLPPLACQHLWHRISHTTQSFFISPFPSSCFY